jgi:hypothetical protein
LLFNAGEKKAIIMPLWRKVENGLTNPQVLLMPEVHKTWHAAQSESGIEQ